MRKIGVTPNVPERQFGQGSVFTRLFTISVNLVPAIPKLRATQGNTGKHQETQGNRGKRQET